MSERESSRTQPRAQYLSPEYVLGEMADLGTHRIMSFTVPQIFILAMLGGAFVTLGGLFAILLATGVETPGLALLLEGLGFSTGFFFVILTHAVLFTEANVVIPATLLTHRAQTLVSRIARFWALAWIGNFFGAFLVGWALHFSQHYPSNVMDLLQEIVARKLEYRTAGGLSAWSQIVVSGVFGNWLVGMAAFFSVMGRTIIGKYIPVLLAVSLFVAANFQHSPANMGFFSLVIPAGNGPDWGTAFFWNILPAGIGNILGGSLLVALPLWYALGNPGRVGTSAPAGETDDRYDRTDSPSAR